jgi:hypothetical protein
MNYMKKSILKPLSLVVLFLGLLGACKESFLDIKPQGALGEATLANEAGVEAALIGAYALLDGYHIDNQNTWAADPVNWILGSVPSDDAYKGSEAGDNPEVTNFELYQWSAGIASLNDKFVPMYEGIARANNTINLTNAAGAGVAGIKDRVRGEALFLRAYYHFELYKVFGHIAYYRETDIDFRKTNEGVDALSEAIVDLQEAVTLLPATQAQKGRVNKIAATAFLGKLLMFRAAAKTSTGGSLADYQAAKAEFDKVLASGASLAPCLRDLFTYATENSSEALFSIQMSLSGDALARNSNWLNQLATPQGGGFGCCGFHQPSQNLVNAYKVGVNGLPLHDTFNSADLVPASDLVDPRIDLTIGRDDVPYWDRAIHGPTFIRARSYAGPYSPKKMQPFKTSPTVAGGWNGQSNNGVNVPIIRLADVILLLAEAEIEINTPASLTRAEELVNMVRTRAGQCAQGPLVDNAGPAVLTTNIKSGDITWAKYEVKPYVVGTFAASQAFARKAVRFERRLELALEGHRFFDIRRYDDMEPGYAATLLNGYVTVEKGKRSYYNDAETFSAKHRWYPLPTSQIQLSITNGVPALKQNDGF